MPDPPLRSIEEILESIQEQIAVVIEIGTKLLGLQVALAVHFAKHGHYNEFEIPDPELVLKIPDIS